MKRTFLSFALVSTALLGACDHYSEKLAALDSELGGTSPTVYASADPSSLNNVATAAGGATVAPAVPYDHALAQAYYERAKEENSVMDYQAAQYFTAKAEEALQGKIPMPARQDQFGISRAEENPELDAARTKLIAALQAPKTPENQQALIEAQVNYDGWVDQVAEGKEGAALTCRDSFMNALSKIEDPFRQESRFTISFVPGQTALDAAGQKAIGDVAELVRGSTDKRYKIVLRSYDQNPDAARFQSIYNALTLQGVQGEGIFTQTASIQTPGSVQPVSFDNKPQTVELLVKFADAQEPTPQVVAPATVQQ